MLRPQATLYEGEHCSKVPGLFIMHTDVRTYISQLSQNSTQLSKLAV